MDYGNPTQVHRLSRGRPSSTQTTTKWVQVDLGQAYAISNLKLHPKWHQGLPGYGFPLRFHVEISNDPTFASSNLVASQTTDLVNPGYYPQSYSVANISARYVRVAATKLYYYAAEQRLHVCLEPA
jgi:alpha-L-rhamnosidase